MKTAQFDIGANGYAHIAPEEPRRAADGSIFVQTLGCGMERITGVTAEAPSSQLVHTFPGNWCGVPTIVGHYFIQSVPAIYGLIVMDIAKPERPVEVSRLTLDAGFRPHWTGWDAKTHRLVVTGTAGRLFMVKLDESTGALTLDTAFHDADGKPGFNFANREWPHGWKGTGQPHGVVFSR